MNVIPIFCAVDDGYAPYLAVALRSLRANTSQPLRVHILIEQLSETHQAALLAMQDEMLTIEFVDVTQKVAAFGQALHLRDYYTKATYYRFFIPELFPQYDKGLYLDCDIAVLDDIAKLYDYDLRGLPLGAVTDEVITDIPVFSCYAEQVLGIPRQEYFNAGILVMDLAQLRRIDLQGALIKLMDRHTFTVAQDQDYLNVLFYKITAILPIRWNKTAFDTCDPLDPPAIVHFKIHFKPWHYQGVAYEEYFWHYAQQTAYYEHIRNELATYTGQQQDAAQYEKLMALAQKECIRAQTAGYELPLRLSLHVRPNPARRAIAERIHALESQGIFDQDVEADPPTRPLQPGEVDYTHTKWVTKISSEIANRVAKAFYDNRIAKGELVIEAVKGLENYLSVADRGVMITCNHFHPNDNYAVFKPIEKSLGRKRLWKIIREGNYTSFTGLYGYFFRHCNTLPLASNLTVFKELLQAVDTLLQRGEKILVYPEQAMWYNYRKPRPLKNGAFHFAAKNGAPILPVFITMRDTNRFDRDGVPIQAYTVHYLPPIFPDPNKRSSLNIKDLCEKNFAAWKSCYEQVYGTPLRYADKEDVCDCISLSF